MNISYTKNGDYLLPDLILEDKKQYNIGKYGLLRLEYIKKYKLGLYFDLLVNDTLNEYLHDIDTIVIEKVQKLITELAEKDNINEQLKENNQMLLVSNLKIKNKFIANFHVYVCLEDESQTRRKGMILKMNNIKNIAEEIILKEYIYV